MNSNSITIPPIHIEICQKSKSKSKSQEIKERVERWFNGSESILISLVEESGTFLPMDSSSVDPFLTQNIDSISLYPSVSIGKRENAMNIPLNSSIQKFFYIYQLNEEEAEAEQLEETDSPACSEWILPAKSLNGLWESLIFDENLKTNLLNYVQTTLLFSDKGVDSNLISWNKVILLHGPPGTGKTTLCKALAQKLSIRLSNRFSHGQLIEINSHSLFSKWFSESGKLVLKLFDKIRELIEEGDSFVCILIDEVESLTSARKSALSGSEPSDAIRVVNALLTQLDQLKKYSNVIVFATSNVTGAIDLAFIDRADIKQYIGLPSLSARYHVLSSCLSELMRVGIISPRQSLFQHKLLKVIDQQTSPESFRLLEISNLCEGMSGRMLRKLPFLAHAYCIQNGSTSLESYLHALQFVIEKEIQGRSQLGNH